MGLAGAIITLGEAETKKEPMEFSLMTHKDGILMLLLMLLLLMLCC